MKYVIWLAAITAVLWDRHNNKQKAERRLREALTNQRRGLVDRLRDNPRGLVLLDNTVLQECELAEVTVLGDHAFIANCLITSK